MEEFYKAGKAKAIGVSNYCPSSIECIMKKATVTPAVNQVQYHVGMGVDPIGVSNYCPSSIECIMQKATVTPAVNQVQYHVGMGVDPIGVKSTSEKHGIHLQAYSPLGN